MERMWKKSSEQCQCGLPSLVDGESDCRNCGRSVEGRKMLGCRNCSFVLCSRCCIGVKLADLGYEQRQIEKMGTSGVYEAISAWARS